MSVYKALLSECYSSALFTVRTHTIWVLMRSHAMMKMITATDPVVMTATPIGSTRVPLGILEYA